MTAPTVKLDAGEQRSLEQQVGLREQRQELLGGRAEYAESRAQLQGLDAKVRGLLEKMESVGEDAYASRIASLRRAPPMITHLLEAEQKILDEYDKALTIIEIEQESLSISEAVDQGALEGLGRRLDTIREAREQTDAAMHELRAIDEVERLLG